MNAADTSASRAMADWTPLTVVSRSSTTAEIETFISDVSTTRTNIAIESRMASFCPPAGGAVASGVGKASMVGRSRVTRRHPAWGGSGPPREAGGCVDRE